MTTVGVLHPGAMGAVLLGHVPDEVLWVEAGRSDASRARAAEAGLVAVPTLEDIVEQSEVLFSVCPPASAEAVAAEVAARGFSGTYVDANAIAPETARRLGAQFERFVDGGIVGPPPTQDGQTRLYLAGTDSADVAALFDGTPVECRVVSGEVGAASAVKACFAAWTKGSTALLLAIRALADAEGVTDDLLGEWQTSMPDTITRSERGAAGAGPKAWRFEGEMRELAAAFAHQGLPAGFHLAAAEVYQQLAPLKGADAVDIESVLRLLGGTNSAD